MMLSRRALIGRTLAGSAVCSLSISSAFGAAAGRADRYAVRPDRYIVDRALTGSAEMIANLNSNRTAVHVFSGDPGSLWMNTLEPALRRRAQTIAGYTSASTLFCLQYLARDYGLALRAHAHNAEAFDRLASGASGEWGDSGGSWEHSNAAALSVLIDSHTLNQRGPISWVLAPKKG